MYKRQIENYETVGKILAGLIATYGTYKAALIINIALTRSWAVAARADAVAKGIQTIATKAQTVAQLALNAAMKANPYVLAATLIVGAATAMWAFRDSTTAAERAQKKYNKTKADSLQKEEEHKSRLEELIATIQNEYTSSCLLYTSVSQSRLPLLPQPPKRRKSQMIWLPLLPMQ